jgi:hypothetical protein
MESAGAIRVAGASPLNQRVKPLPSNQHPDSRSNTFINLFILRNLRHLGLPANFFAKQFRLFPHSAHNQDVQSSQAADRTRARTDLVDLKVGTWRKINFHTPLGYIFDVNSFIFNKSSLKSRPKTCDFVKIWRRFET